MAARKVTASASTPSPEIATALAALATAASARLSPETGVEQGEFLAAFEALSNVLGSHGFVPAGATILVNRADFEALKAAGAVAGDWPEDESSAG